MQTPRPITGSELPSKMPPKNALEARYTSKIGEELLALIGALPLPAGDMKGKTCW